METAWARYAMCESAFTGLQCIYIIYIYILFTCGLSNDACRDSDFTELNGRISNEDTTKGSVVTWYEILF